MSPTKDQIKEYYSAALRRSLEAYTKLDEKEWDKKITDLGTAKDHLAQLVGTMESETLPISRQAIGGETLGLPGMQQRSEVSTFRVQSQKAVATLSTAELLQRMQAAFEEHLAMLDGLSEGDLDRPVRSPAWDRPGTIRDLFFASYLFLPGQYQDIRKANKKKLPHWIEASTPEQVNYHMGRLFHYMPLIFRSDKGAEAKATYLFTMEGAGGGQWNIAIGDGRADATDGAPPADPDIEIKTKPEHWIDLTTGDLNPIQAIMPGPLGKVKLSGQMGLALKLSEYFSAEE